MMQWLVISSRPRNQQLGQTVCQTTQQPTRNQLQPAAHHPGSRSSQQTATCDWRIQSTYGATSGGNSLLLVMTSYSMVDPYSRQSNYRYAADFMIHQGTVRHQNQIFRMGLFTNGVLPLKTHVFFLRTGMNGTARSGGTNIYKRPHHIDDQPLTTIIDH